MLVILTHFFSS